VLEATSLGVGSVVAGVVVDPSISGSTWKELLAVGSLAADELSESAFVVEELTGVVAGPASEELVVPNSEEVVC
jgi:TRAP-type C4-dicarboxylate transport system permease large subunit